MVSIPSLVSAVLDLTVYGEVVKALNDPGCTKSVIKRFTEQRKLAFVILGGIVAFYVTSGQLNAAANIVVFILLCSHISATYDGINEDTYKTYVQSLGPAAFTIINILPVIISQGLLCIEVVTTYRSKPLAVVVLLLVAAPRLLQVIAGSARASHITPSTEA